MMSGLADLDRLLQLMLWISVAMAVLAMCATVVERSAFALLAARRHRIEHHYEPVIRRALAGDDGAERVLAVTPPTRRLIVASMLITPLIDDRDPQRIARTRSIVERMSLVPRAERYLQSWRWWRRALALRVLGLLQIREQTPALIAALDDADADVRAAALDALTDMRDPAALQAIVVRLHDSSLQPARRLAALTALGQDIEGFLLELAHVDRANRLNYARALRLCGSERARAALSEWVQDPRPEVQAASFEALAHVGLDEASAALAIDGLNSDVPMVRAMAAHALHGWTTSGDAAVRLAEHLDDVWIVAVRAAQSLQTMGPQGLATLQQHASRTDLPGVLARQMLWETTALC
jgi:HEAT repeat protein